MNVSDTLRGVAFGAVGGAVGTYLMSYYWKAAEALHGHDPRLLTREEPPHGMDDISAVGEQAQEGEGSTAAVGRILHAAATGDEPSEEQKSRLSEGVHWSYGIAVSALYGAVRGRKSIPDAVGGAAFGTALWALGDELMVPLLGLSRGPTAYPVEQHAHRFGAHIFYGVVAAATTQALFRAFAPAPAPTRREVVMNAVKAYATVKAAKSIARAAAGAGSKLVRAIRPQKQTPLQKAVRSTQQFTRAVGPHAMKGVRRAARSTQKLARAASNGATHSAVQSVVRSSRNLARTATGVFS